MPLNLVRRRNRSRQDPDHPAQDTPAARYAERVRRPDSHDNANEPDTPRVNSSNRFVLMTLNALARVDPMSSEMVKLFRRARVHRSLEPAGYLSILQRWSFETRLSAMTVDTASPIHLYSQPTPHGPGDYSDASMYIRRVIKGDWNGQPASFISMEAAHMRAAHNSWSFIEVTVYPEGESGSNPVIVAWGPGEVYNIPIRLDEDGELYGIPAHASMATSRKLAKQLDTYPHIVASRDSNKKTTVRWKINECVLGGGIPILVTVGVVIRHDGEPFRLEAKVHPDDILRYLSPRPNKLTPLIVDPVHERNVEYSCQRPGCIIGCRRLDLDHFNEESWRMMLCIGDVLGYDRTAHFWVHTEPEPAPEAHSET